MPVYEYRGNQSRKGGGGIVDADNAKTARSKLRAQGIFPTVLQAEKGRVTWKGCEPRD